jgi:hypothetical protein
MRRVGIYANGCDLPSHRDHAGEAATTVPLVDDLDEFVAWWATARDNNGPEPTREQIQAGRRGGLAAVPGQDGGY